MIELETKTVVDAEDMEMVPIFSIDGVVYSIPNKERPAVSYQYLLYIREKGLGWAESWLAEELLGKDGYQALLDYKGFSHELFDQITTAARDIVFGNRRPKVTSQSNGTTQKPRRTTRRASGSST